MTPRRARGPRGQRVVGRVPRNRGTVTTVIGALTLTGVTALMTIEGATSGDVFAAYVTKVLVPTLKKGDVVVLDNVGAHKSVAAHEAIKGAGASVIFQPPYSPDLNPIEECWSKFKHEIAKQEPRTVPQLDKAIARAAEKVTPSDAVGWFQHCGIRLKRAAARILRTGAKDR